MKCCNQQMVDWGYHKKTMLGEKIRHFYCHKCGTHHYKGKTYTKDEWFFYINEMSFADYRKKQIEDELMENSTHAYEISNHSNPEK